MRFDDPDALRRAGFTGFESIAALRASRLAIVPEEPGVYLVIRPNRSEPRFLDANPSGRYKRRDPTEDPVVLRAAWVRRACVLYIGKAGERGRKATLRQRLGRYLRQGRGHSAGHFGGRFVWQLADASTLLVAWRIETDPDAVESQLIESFRAAHGMRPFANLRR